MIGLRRMAGAVRAVVAPSANVASLVDCFATLKKHSKLCAEMVKRDLGAQYAGQVFGLLWIVGHPLILFGVYTFIFSVVLKTRVDTSFEMPRDYTTYILAGLAPWLSIQQALARAPNALISQSNLVKQVVFPIEVLPFGAVVSASIPMLMGVAVLVLRLLYTGGEIPLTIALLPVAIAFHTGAVLGVAYLLSAITPFFRDIKDFVAALTLIGVYLVPAFYLPSWVPPLLRPWLYLNPFSYIIWIYQDVLYFGEIRHPWAWLVSALFAAAGLALGYRAFRRLKPFVANVL